MEPDEVENESSNEDEEFDHYDAGNEYIRESAASPPTSNSDGFTKDNFTKDAANGSSKNPSHKSNGLFDGKFYDNYLNFGFGFFACLLSYLVLWKLEILMFSSCLLLITLFNIMFVRIDFFCKLLVKKQ